jgi:diguanylate cyclase (GGDEF)-like protein
MIIDHFYRNLLESLPHVVLVATPLVAPETGLRDFLIEYVNPAWETVSGSQVKTIQGKLLSATIYAKSAIPWLEMAESVWANKKALAHTAYSELLGKWLDITIVRLEPEHICIYIHDVTDLKQGETRLKEQNMRLSALSSELTASKNNLKVKLEKIETLNANLEQLAYYDRLTRLPNRTRFSEILSDELEEARRAERRLAIAIFDIDNLKTINDSRGHESGDEILKQVAERLGHFKQEAVQASRFGGDEFLLVIQDYEHDAELLHKVNAIQEILRDPYMIFDAELKSSVSIGIATFPEDADNVQDLLKYADIAMTDAKRRGKNTLSLFHSVMQENLLERLDMEQRMFSALEEERFQVFFQPQFNAASRKLRGFEALVRWFDSELGYVPPDKFIPLAEETRVIVPLGRWILSTACRTLSDWQDQFAFDGIMSVNVSPVQLQQTDFIDDLKNVLEETGIEPETLEIEITEGVLISNFAEAVRILQEIRALGVGISLDDFGTGYSSLSYLQTLPLTTLKIDKSFIDNITKEKSVEYDITDAMVNLMNKLGLDTIAEGVETDAQLKVIQRIKCKTVQGFLTGRPMPRGDCEKIIASGVYAL